MDITHFDTIGRLFARRLVRRELVAAGDASPVPPADGDRIATLFVQSFRGGDIAPTQGEEGHYTFTLTGGLGQTICFSDRPERRAGTVPTPQFLDGLGFSPDNPPNAALVVETAAGQTGIAVVELFNPAYDEGTHTATYDVAVLQEWDNTLGTTMTPSDVAALLAPFGSAHLFIDDCPDASIVCYTNDAQHLYVGVAGVGGLCWSWDTWSCVWCDATSADHICNVTFPECDNYCRAQAIPYER